MSAPVYILGGYQSDFAKSWSRQGQDISDMVKEATQGVLDHAGLDTSAIESIHVGNACDKGRMMHGDNCGAIVFCQSFVEPGQSFRA